MEFSPYSTFLPCVLQSQKTCQFYNQTRRQRLSLIVASSDRSSWRYDAPLLVNRKGSNFFEIFTSVTPKLLHVQCNLITQGNSRQLTQCNRQTNKCYIKIKIVTEVLWKRDNIYRRGSPLQMYRHCFNARISLQQWCGRYHMSGCCVLTIFINW